MQLDKQGIIEYVKKAIVKLRSEGKVDLEKTIGASTRLRFYQELYPNKITPTIKIEEERFPGTLDRIIAQGIAQGLIEPIKKITPENVELSESDYKDIEWDVKMALAKEDLDSTSLDYQQKFQELFKQLEAQCLQAKKAKLLAGQADGHTLEIVEEEIQEQQIYSEEEVELVNALTYVEDLKALLKNPQARIEAYAEMDRDFLLVWERLERQKKTAEEIITGAVIEIAPDRPKEKQDRIELVKKFWLTYGRLIAKAANDNEILAEKMRNTYKRLKVQGLNNEQVKRETYRLSLKSAEPIVAQARKDAFAILWPQPIELRFKRSFRKCRKPSDAQQSPLDRGESLKIALERALNMAPCLREKKAVLDKMSRENRPFMPSGQLKRRQTP